MDSVSRREFLITGAAAGGGLLLAWHMGAAATATPAVFAPNAFIRIGTDGRVTMIIGQVEMGQGMYTSMPMLIAEELEVGLDQVRIEHAPPDDKLYVNPLFGFQATGGSTSVKGLYLPMRRAGATARTMLIAAAAKLWNVDPATCRAERGALGTAQSLPQPPNSRSPKMLCSNGLKTSS
jgi:isoquinoline 1-oxidoreductase beta subunit